MLQPLGAQQPPEVAFEELTVEQCPSKMMTWLVSVVLPDKSYFNAQLGLCNIRYKR
jgi:hypothetical protein